MPNYSKTVIYKIFCKDSNVTNIYIGSTTNFNKRKSKHKNDYYNENSRIYNCKVYQYIRENGGFSNFEMVIIEEYPCNNKKEVLERERYFIKELKASLNTEIPGRTVKEYYQDNKEKIKENRKDYYQDNKEKIKENRKDYYEINKEKIKEKDKEYYLNNKEKKKEYREKYKQNNKEKIKEYYHNNKEKLKEKIICECGCEILKKGLKIHQQSAKHINLMAIITKNNF